MSSLVQNLSGLARARAHAQGLDSSGSYWAPLKGDQCNYPRNRRGSARDLAASATPGPRLEGAPPPTCWPLRSSTIEPGCRVPPRLLIGEAA